MTARLRLRLRPLAVTGLLVTATLSLWTAASAHAVGETCAGKPATMVVSTAQPGDHVDGTGGDDVIVVTYAGGLSIDALGGNDTVCGGPGTYWIEGGEGDDDLWSRADDSGFRGLWGRAGDDSLHGDAAPEVLEGGEGDDTIAAGGGDDTIAGDAAITPTTAPGSDDDTIHAGPGADEVIDDWGNDTLTGGDGHDELVLGVASQDPVDEGCSPALHADATLRVTAGTVTGFGSDTFSGFETYVGGTTPSTLIGTPGRDDLRSGDCGTARLFGLGGGDHLEGTSQAGGLVGGNRGDDKVYLSGPYDVHGDRGNDRVHLAPSQFTGFSNHNEILTGRGTDRIVDGSYTFYGIDLRRGLDFGTGSGSTRWLTVRGVENARQLTVNPYRGGNPYGGATYLMVGTSGPNVLTAAAHSAGSTTALETVMRGLRGNDRLLAGRHDTAYGGPGRDSCHAQRRIGCERR
jgi:hypothetical protein